jgi:hypothetical protein
MDIVLLNYEIYTDIFLFLIDKPETAPPYIPRFECNNS